MVVFIFPFLICVPTQVAEDFQSQWEASCMIRHDKFNYILPKAMRRNNIDMWIVLDHGRGTEPLMLDLGIETAYGHGIYIFFDGGGDRVERLCLGGPGSSDLSDICGAYDVIHGKADLRSVVYERDPKRIGLNYIDPPIHGEGIHTADGLSLTDYEYLVEELGEKYAKRFVSAQRLIADFHGEHVAGEIIEFAKVAELTHRTLERALSNEVIIPGRTTHFQVEMWLEERRAELGLGRTWVPGVAFPAPGTGEYQSLVPGTFKERVIQRGDILYIDWGLMRNNFSTDMKRYAYVLKVGEEDAPPGLIRAFEEAKTIREIIRKNVRSGRTGREQLDELKQIVRDAGYVYTEKERASEVPGIEVNIGMHGMDSVAHDVTAGLAEFQPELTEYEIRPNAFLALEFRIFMPAEEWGGKKIPVAIEENVLITERGLEWLHPPQDRILIIR
jgi:Xaa-Pro aminopeptidase